MSKGGESRSVIVCLPHFCTTCDTAWLHKVNMHGHVVYKFNNIWVWICQGWTHMGTLSDLRPTRAKAVLPVWWAHGMSNPT